MKRIELAEHGLATVADVCEAKGWSRKTVQNWVNAGLLPAVPVGGGHSTFLLRLNDVENFTPPPRGRPPLKRRKARAGKAGS